MSESKENEPKPSTSKRHSTVASDTAIVSKAKRISIRAQSELLMQTAKSTGIDSKGLSKSNIHRTGSKVIRESAEEIRTSINNHKGENLFLHYDGKVVKELTKGKNLSQERLALSIKCGQENNLLAIPACINSTGECQTEKIIEILESYELKHDIQGLVFDTTASNTGKHKGVNTRLNEYLGKPILHLACRHHVYECHIKNVSKLFRTSCGPDHPLFKKLQEQFADLEMDQSNFIKYEYGKNLELDKDAEHSLKTVSELLDENKFPRGDYRELAELIRYFLSPSNCEIVFKQPGPVHHARFMGQAIYYMKLKILGKISNMQTTSAVKKEVDLMSEFVSLYYGKWFLTSSIIPSSRPNSNFGNATVPKSQARCGTKMPGKYEQPLLVSSPNIDPDGFS